MSREISTAGTRVKVNEFANMIVEKLKYHSPANKQFLATMLWGPPGIGKSMVMATIVEKVLEDIPKYKKVNVRDVRLLLQNPIDLRGIPVADMKLKVATWLMPEIYKMEDSPDTLNILFLDEISAAPPSVQAAAYQLVLDRIVGEHKLPDNCYVICAGNRVTDKSVAYKMPKALANRMYHFEVYPEFDDWKNWAIKAGVNPQVIAYLSKAESKLNAFDPSSDDNAFPTPRSWAAVSEILNYSPYDNDKVVEKEFLWIQAAIGLGVANEFKAFCRVYDKLPNLQDIITGKLQSVPENTDIDICWAINSGLVFLANKHLQDETLVQEEKTKIMENILNFSINLKKITKQAELGVKMAKDIVRIPKSKTYLTESKSWQEFCGVYGRYFFNSANIVR